MATILLTMILVLLVLLVIGVPIGFTFALSGVVGGIMAGLPLGTISSSAYYALASFPLLAIPLFILAGDLMNQGKLIDRLTNLNELFLFWIPGRMGHISIVSSAFLGAMTGSSVATVAAISGSMGKKMIDKGYDKDYVAALCSSSGLLGVLIPPSIPLIVYGAAVGVSVADLFLATLIPGIMMTIVYMGLHSLSLKKVLSLSSVGAESELSTKMDPEIMKNAKKYILKSIPAMIMPIIILGGIYSGITTPTEAAGAAALYTGSIILILRMIKPKQMIPIFMNAAKTAGSIMVIIAFTSIFNKMMTLIQVPQYIATFTVSLTDNKYLFLVFVNILLFIIGMFMETNAAVILMSPLLFPAAMQMGVDPVHFGIILVTNIEIGLITPPMAANIYVSARVNKSSVVEMWPHQWKFLLCSILVLIIITYIPELSLWWK